MTDISPKFELHWDKRSKNAQVNSLTHKNGLTVTCCNLDEYIEIEETASTLTVIIGHPILGDKIDVAGTIDHLAQDRDLKDINGQFLFIIFNKKLATLKIINDRFTSFPVYFANLNNHFILNISYQGLAQALNAKNLLNISSEHCYEYILLQRLVGTKTLDTMSQYLPSATKLEISERGSFSHQYWTPNFTKVKRTTKQAGIELAELLTSSLNRLTSDKKRYGLMLSAGHDSRTIAMAAKERFKCFTVAYSDNLEVRLARKIAEQSGHDHHFIKLSANHLTKTAQEAGRLCGGMYSIDNAFFFGIEGDVSQHVDVLLHGHGIDYMFQGMYIPSNCLSLFNRPTFIKFAKPLGENLTDFFLENIGYRLKYIDRSEYLLPEYMSTAYDSVRQSVADAFGEAPENCRSPEDKWEFMIVNGLSRHYSWPNIGSKMSLAQVRTPCFDNDVLNFYLSLPANQRVTAKVLRSAQLHLDRKTALIATANFGFPAAESPFKKTARLIIRKVIRDFTGNGSFAAPELSDRTWPDRDTHLSIQAGYQSLVHDAVNSPAMEEALPQFNWPKIRAIAKESFKRPQGKAGFLISLVSLHLFLRKIV